MKKLITFIFFSILVTTYCCAQHNVSDLDKHARDSVRLVALKSNLVWGMFYDLNHSTVNLLGTYSNPSWITALAPSKVLPVQTGHAGAGLTTDGTNISWDGTILKGPVSYSYIPFATTSNTLSNSNVTYDGSTIFFAPGVYHAGLNVGVVATDPSSPTNGELWVNSTAGKARIRVGGTTIDIGSGGGGGSGTVTSISGSGGSTGLTLTGGPITSSGTLTLGGTLAVANGGTGTASPGLIAGSNITVSGSWPNQTVTSTASGSGSVTTVSVATSNGFAGTVATATTTPVITLSTGITGIIKGNGTSLNAATSGTDYAPATSGTLILKGNGSGGFSSASAGTDFIAPYGSQTANTFLAAPNGSSGSATFRAISSADIPNNAANTTGSAATLATSRNINGVAFNGSADITVPVATSIPNTYLMMSDGFTVVNSGVNIPSSGNINAGSITTSGGIFALGSQFTAAGTGQGIFNYDIGGNGTLTLGGGTGSNTTFLKTIAYNSATSTMSLAIKTGDALSTNNNSGDIYFDNGAKAGTGKVGNIGLFCTTCSFGGAEKSLFIANNITNPSTSVTGGFLLFSNNSNSHPTLRYGTTDLDLTTLGTGSVNSVSGTTNRITSTGGATPVVDISTSYVGQPSITTTGTITTGVWNGTTVAIANGGTGQTTANAAFNALAPSQTSNGGKILTTDGFNTGWTTSATGVTTATATTIAGRDANANLTSNNYISNLNSTATAAGTTTLTVSSARDQYFTGSTTQTVVMPVASTMQPNQLFEIVNNSTGALTINSSGGNLIQTMVTSSRMVIKCILTSGTTAASWDFKYSPSNPVTAVGDLVVGTGSAAIGKLTVGSTNQLLIVTSGTPAWTTGVPGTATNDNATTGYVGEGNTVIIAPGSAVSLTTATTSNLLSVSLAAGDYDIEGMVTFSETTATVSARSAQITSTSATITVDGTEGNNGVQSTVTSEKNTIALSGRIFKLPSTTTIYIAAQATFSAGSTAVYGYLKWRRVR